LTKARYRRTNLKFLMVRYMDIKQYNNAVTVVYDPPQKRNEAYSETKLAR
jgi:hypothetical protein